MWSLCSWPGPLPSPLACSIRGTLEEPRPDQGPLQGLPPHPERDLGPSVVHEALRAPSSSALCSPPLPPPPLGDPSSPQSLAKCSFLQSLPPSLCGRATPSLTPRNPATCYCTVPAACWPRDDAGSGSPALRQASLKAGTAWILHLLRPLAEGPREGPGRPMLKRTGLRPPFSGERGCM